MESETKVKPVEKIDCFPVSISVWESKAKAPDGKEYISRSFTISRAYKDAAGKWQYSSSLRKRDLPNLLVAIQKLMDKEFSKNDNNEESA